MACTGLSCTGGQFRVFWWCTTQRSACSTDTSGWPLSFNFFNSFLFLQTPFNAETTFCKALDRLALASFRGTQYSQSIFCLSSALESTLQDIINTETHEKLIILILEMLEHKLLYKKKPIIQQYHRATFFKCASCYSIIFPLLKLLGVLQWMQWEDFFTLLNGLIHSRKSLFHYRDFWLNVEIIFSWFVQKETHLPEQENRSQTTDSS